MQVIQNDVIKCCKMMSSIVVLLHSNNCCVVLEPVICEDVDLHVAIFCFVLTCIFSDAHCSGENIVFTQQPGDEHI